MARRLLIVVLGATLLLSAATPASAGSHIKLSYWAGHTSQSGQIGIELERVHHRLRFVDAAVEIQLTCEDSTTQDWGIAFGTISGEPLVDKQLDYYVNFGDLAISLTGDFSRDRAIGTIRLSVAELTSDEQAQLCTSGDLTWVAHHQPAPSTGASSSFGRAYGGPGSIVVRGPGLVAHMVQH